MNGYFFMSENCSQETALESLVKLALKQRKHFKILFSEGVVLAVSSSLGDVWDFYKEALNMAVLFVETPAPPSEDYKCERTATHS